MKCDNNGVCVLESDIFFNSEYKIHFLIKLLIDDGGSQNNQFKNIAKFLSCKKTGHKYVAILDGEYFDKNKKDQLYKMIDNKSSFIVSMNELEVFLKANLSVWQKLSNS